MSKYILVVDDYDDSYSKYWGNLGPTRQTGRRSPEQCFTNPQEIALVCFTGGDDVSPELYGHKNLASHNSVRRDAYEGAIFDLAAEYSIPMTGICRGAQFLNVKCGGTMVQHLRKDHGGGRHESEMRTGETFEVTSSHHQMIVPAADGEIWGWAEQRLRPSDLIYDGELPKTVLDPNNPDFVRVTEMIAYPNRRIVGCQSHPEWQSIGEAFPQYMLNLIRKVCLEGR